MPLRLCMLLLPLLIGCSQRNGPQLKWIPISKTIYMKTIRSEKRYILSIFRSLEPVKQREERIRQGALLHGADARMIRIILVMQEAQPVMTGQAKGDYSISSPLIVLAGVLPQHTASTG
ncbi:hypothetical protein BDZ91DRAFT_766022 [Kalaharituber pfeilii]|nr:hypothetical protein BDZ91DRAFT_769056 [Kalaharituber pfeilii]KAF8442504.1 hypothetical protein BDZ91DRAFT_769007 [Kalaharituber pfeilii]KAF8460956.1 hypothetical protein BDZ91DRAFT_766022 [Kalaharituber pfeilii]